MSTPRKHPSTDSRCDWPACAEYDDNCRLGPPRDYFDTYGDEQRRDHEEGGGLTPKIALAYVAVTIAGFGLGALIGWAMVQMVTVMAQVLAALVVGL